MATCPSNTLAEAANRDVARGNAADVAHRCLAATKNRMHCLGPCAYSGSDESRRLVAGRVESVGAVFVAMYF